MESKIHPLADVHSTEIGEDTVVWQFSVILKGAIIGKNCNLNCHTFVESDVVVGDNVTIKSGVYLWNGIKIENNVFVGPNVTFVNDLYPRSKVYQSFNLNTYIKEGASIGANSTILGGITVGSFSLIGAGSVITKNVPDYALVYGNPGKIMGWVDREGRKLRYDNGVYISQGGKKFKVEDLIIREIIDY